MGRGLPKLRVILKIPDTPKPFNQFFPTPQTFLTALLQPRGPHRSGVPLHSGPRNPQIYSLLLP